MSEHTNESEVVVITTQDAPKPLISAEEKAIQFRKELEALKTQPQEEVTNNEQERPNSVDDSRDGVGS